MRLTKALVLVAIATATANAHAITIIRNFYSSGNAFPGSNGTAGNAGNTAGGNSLQGLFNTAADIWEDALQDNHTVTLHYGWQSLGGGTLGVHSLLTQGGSPNRETAGVIRFDNDAGTPWFSDLTPMVNSEYSTFTASTGNFGGGTMNTGRVWTGASGNALNRYDLFSVVLHEIGHSLGLSSANTAFIAGNGDFDVDVTAPRPFAGSQIPTVSGAHLNISTAAMWPSVSDSTRKLLSSADILANAEISKFTQVNLDPVPEPATMVALGLGLAGLVVRRKKRAA
jgi:hypothetical protein